MVFSVRIITLKRASAQRREIANWSKNVAVNESMSDMDYKISNWFYSCVTENIEREKKKSTLIPLHRV